MAETIRVRTYTAALRIPDCPEWRSTTPLPFPQCHQALDILGQKGRYLLSSLLQIDASYQVLSSRSDM